jgi:hypothetical protein
MEVQWLPGDDRHPIRPDLPVLRHLTFTEVHALELGAYVGLLAYFATRYGYGGEVVVLLLAITRYTISAGRATACRRPEAHRLGFHDVRSEPPYFGAGFLGGFVAVAVGVRLWRLLDLGPIVV